MRSSKRSTEAAGLFWAAWGAVTLLFQLPLTQMILDDPESLMLGVWNGPTFALFCVLSFAIVPAAAGALFAVAGRVANRWGKLLFIAVFAYILAMQINYHYLQPRFLYHYLQPHFLGLSWRRVALVALWAVISAAGWAFEERLFRLLKTCAFLSPVVFLAFAAQAWPAAPARSAAPAPQARPATAGETPPVFFLTFEKICSSYVTGTDGQLLADRFPNLAKFAAEGDYYPETHANCTATVYSLKTLYSGRVSTRERNWTRHPQIKSILGTTLQPVLQLDLLTDYGDPYRDVCLRSIGRDKLRGIDLISGWYKTYILTIVPDPIELRLTLLGWHFNPWTDMWSREGTELAPGEELHHHVGKKQLELLKQEIRRQAGNPCLYIMHNFISDNPGVKASELTRARWEQYPDDLERARKNLRVFDRELGGFLDFLRAEGLYDRSLIVITADTGYDYDSRRAKGDAELPASRDLTRVFFALKRPGQTQGRVFRSALRQVDVLPTLLTDLGIDPHPFHFEGTAVTDPAESSSLQQRPLEFFLTSEQAGVLHYRLKENGGSFQRVKP